MPRLLPDRAEFRAGLRAVIAAFGAFATLGVAVRATHGSAGAIVLGVMVAFSLTRRRHGRDQGPMLVALPVLTVCVALLAAAMRWSPPLGDTLFVAIVFLSSHIRRYGPRAARLGRLMTVPMIALFVSPIPVGNAPLHALAWAVAACVTAALWSALAARLIPSREPGDPGGDTTPASPVHTRLGAQSAAALALAFVTGQTLFPDHWAWTVITAVTVTVGARSRGHVLHKSVQRFAGAVIGTVAATLAAGALLGHPAWSVAVILGLLAAGLTLREVDYAYWSLCFTALLAILYGLMGQAGTAFLAERLEQIVLGAGCAVLPAFLLMPVRTETLIRRHLSRTLEALGDILVPPPTDQDPAHQDPAKRHPESIAEFDRRLAALTLTAEPVVAWHRLASALRVRPHPGLAAGVAPLAACGPACAALLADADGDDATVPCPELTAARAALRRNVGAVRLTLARRPAPALLPVPLPSCPDRRPAVAAIDAALRAVHAHAST